MRKTMHWDLNAMRPPMERFPELLSLAADAGYDSLMIGWEDKFPWKEPAYRADSAFTSDEILKIVEIASSNGLDFIPMIQCLGHLENFLKLPENASLREVPDRYDCLNPLAEGALEFVMALLEEMLALSPGIKYFHIGGDEVWTMGSHIDTKAFIEEQGAAKLFLKQARPIIETLNSRGIRPLMWHDMMIKWEDEDIQSIKDDVDIVFWGYGQPIDKTPEHYNIKHVERFAALGMSLWGAGAYKGGSGPGSITPDVQALAANAVSWRKAAERFKFKGLMATGWSRYSQFHFPCDPIYLSLESLFVIGGILDGCLDESESLEKLGAALRKRGVFELNEKLSEAAETFAKDCSTVWECLRNLRQQEVMEKTFLQGEGSHIAKLMEDEFIKQLENLKRSADALRKLMTGLANEEDIAQFIDTKVDALCAE